VVKFPSKYAIGETVDFCFDIDNLPVADMYRGIITAVRFTKAKVFYDIVDDYSGDLHTRVDSCCLEIPKKKKKK